MKTVKAVSVPTFVGSYSYLQERWMPVLLVLSPERIPAIGFPTCTDMTHLGYILAG